ncbi:MAG TPA: hypothetical protein VM554_12925 [Acidisarcina sp.]|nr:hypothetical protein [Acidisarcina sp.]
MKELVKFLCDLGVIAGAGVFVYGLWLAWPPLGFVVGGLLVSAASFFLGYGATRFRGRNQ